MGNQIKGEVPFTAEDGRRFTLVLDMEALLSIEDATDKPLPEVLARAQRGFLSAMADIALAAFGRNHPEITRADVLAFVDSDRTALTAAIADAVNATFPKPSAGGKAEPAKRRPGKTSGRSGARQG